MIVSAYGFNDVLSDHVVLDPSRVAAQVVSGIGFLGAGSILLRGSVIRGLTTAASIWTVAAIGLAIGGGLYFAGVVSTLIILDSALARACTHKSRLVSSGWSTSVLPQEADFVVCLVPKADLLGEISAGVPCTVRPFAAGFAISRSNGCRVGCRRAGQHVPRS
jgi:hypothetical protein